MNVIKDVLIELRPRLRSCNVAISTQCDSPDQFNIKVSVRPNLIILNYTDYQAKCEEKSRNIRDVRKDSTSSYESFSESEDEGYDFSKFINVSPHCKILPSSLSLVKVETEFLSFRLLTEPIDSKSGTFYTEIVNNTNNEYSINTNASENFVHIDRKCININKDDSVRLFCANCLNNLTVSVDEVENFVIFNRVLELPSENLDVSDWFCHSDCNNDKNLKLIPKNNDILYGLCCFIINNINISSNFLEFNKNRNILHCDRCLSWLGVKHDSDSVKLWDSCIKFHKSVDSDKYFHLFAEKEQDKNMNVSLINFLYAIKYGIKNSFVSAVSPTCKLILECEITKDKKQYMLLWVMDKFLDVLKTEKNISTDDADDVNEIKLKHILTSKLLYRIDDKSDMVKQWSDDCSVQSFQISKDMFLEGKKHLAKMSSHIPNSFRKSNDFCLTYLKI